MQHDTSQPFLQVDKTWTLFLDRDGVINIEKHNDYIKSPEEFVFYKNVPETIVLLNKIFGRIILVTNQRGIGRGLMTHKDLHSVHSFMLGELNRLGGSIDQIYYAPDIEANAPNRKPNIGMGLQAKKDFPEINFLKSVMVGNNLSDMEFGKSLGMTTIFLETTHPAIENEHLIDFRFKTLSEIILLFNE